MVVVLAGLSLEKKVTLIGYLLLPKGEGSRMRGNGVQLLFKAG
jgi:hypothetical protein